MRKLLALILGAGCIAAGTAGCSGRSAEEIQFDIGKNIVDIAGASGVPQYEIRKIGNRIDYTVNALPDGASAKFIRPGHEVTAAPVASFTMYGVPDQSSTFQANMAIVHVQTRELKTHAQAQALVEKTIAQFQTGTWRRHFRPQDARLTGRSSLLNEAGQLDVLATGALDPAYRIPAQDWVAAASQNPTWRWTGDGVLSTLEVGFSETPGQGIRYKISLVFELAAQSEQRIKEEAARQAAGRESTPWNNTAKYEAELKAVEAKNKVLEENAVKRGDGVLPKR